MTTAVPGPRASALCEELAEFECPAHTTRRARRAEASGASHDPIVWAAAHGSNVVDVDGNVYVDLTAGFGAALVGHTHAAVVAAVQRQAARMMHSLGDVYPSDVKIALEKRLARLAPWAGARVILGLSGSDAVEAALKTAALATGRPGVIAFGGGYHGLSYGPLAACGYKAAFRTPFAEQLGAHVTFVPYPGRGAAVRATQGVQAALAGGNIGALLIEPILGRGGVIEAEAGALSLILSQARAAGVVVIADEIYTGMKRASNEWLFSNAWPALPDVVCIGKALGGTMPVSACLIRSEIAEAWGAPGGEAIHTSTFLGNPLGAAAALATLDVLDAPETTATFDRASTRLWKHALEPIASDPRAQVVALGGSRLLAGIQLAGGSTRSLAVVRALLERGYLALPGGTAGDWITLTPPGTITDAQIDGFARSLREVLYAVSA